MPVPADLDGRRTYELDRAHVFHSWSAQAAPDPLVIAGAHGSTLVDADGREYLDFSSQLIYTNLVTLLPGLLLGWPLGRWAASRLPASRLRPVALVLAGAAGAGLVIKALGQLTA